MDIKETLRGQGWHLSSDAVQQISDNGTVTSLRLLHNKVLDLDLREISVPYFPEELFKGKLETISGNVIVQVQKVRNISAPKASEESQAAPRLLKVVLTDGHTVCTGVEVEPINSLSLNTAPGTKVLLQGEVSLSHGLLLLRPSLVHVLGGKVTTLIDKWELKRSLAKHTRGRIGEEGGPPAWIPFGQKILKQNLHENTLRSLGEIAKENSEFEAQRQGAIEEATRGGARKVFGGGNRPLLDRNVRTLMDQGYSQDQAEQALRQTRNNVDRALQTLQRRLGGGGSAGCREERGVRRKGERDEEGGAGLKPSSQLSLFAFLEDKLPSQTEKEERESINQAAVNQSDQRHYVSQRGRSSRGSHSSLANRPNNTVCKSQKPPRFQNQSLQKYKNDSFQNLNIGNNCEYSYEDKNNFNNPRLKLNSEHFNNDSYNRRTQITPPFTNNDSGYDCRRNNHRYDMHNSAGAGYKSNISRQLLEAGMPEIPEFPFKDTSSMPTLLNNNSNSPIVASGTWQWKIGDKCMAKYWEDSRYYNAEVTGLSKKTCVVRFLEYGNFEEVLQDDCIPATEEPMNYHTNANSTHISNNNHFSGILEFRRGGTRPYIKSVDTHRKSQRNSQPMYVPPAQRKD